MGWSLSYGLPIVSDGAAIPPGALRVREEQWRTSAPERGGVLPKDRTPLHRVCTGRRGLRNNRGLRGSGLHGNGQALGGNDKRCHRSDPSPNPTDLTLPRAAKFI